MIRLVEFDTCHLTEDYVAWLNDPEIVKFSQQRFMEHTMETCRGYFESKQSIPKTFLAIEFLEQGSWSHIGNIGVDLNLNDKVADLSILIGERNLQNKGVGSIAWKLGIEHCFREFRLDCITAGTMELNLAMRRIFEKSNMVIDAILPSRYLIDGTRVGMVCAHLPRASSLS